MRMSEPRRLHPVSAIANCLKQIKELIIPFLVFVVFGSRSDIFQLVISVVILAFVLISGILTWLRYTYRLEEGELRIEYGVFVRKKRYIPFERIQSLDLSEGILQRLFGLVKVKVETAGGSNEAEAVLTAVSKEEANSIKEIVFFAKRDSREKEDRAFEKGCEQILYKISLQELFLLASTSGGVGVVLSAVLAFVFQFEEFIPYEQIFRGIEDVVSDGIFFISIIIFIGFLIAWLIALIGTMIKYSGFTLIKKDEELIISRGLLEKRQLTIPLQRVQAVRISENLIRQPLGLCTVYMESAGGSNADKENAKVMALPVIKKNCVASLLSEHLADYELEPVIRQAPKRALGRYAVRGLLIVLPVIAALVTFFRPWGLLAAIPILLLSFLWSFISYRDAGWNIHHQQLTLRYRTIIKNTVMMKRNKIQSLSMHESIFQRRGNLATIRASVLSGLGGSGGKVKDLDKEDVLASYKWYSYTK